MKAVAGVLLVALGAAGCGDNRAIGEQVSGGVQQERAARQLLVRSAERGQRLIAEVGCGSCHTVPGVRGAEGKVAPPLYWFARRTFIAGEVPNNYDNLVRWLKDPPSVEPGTAMPNLGLTDAQSRDIAAYLLTLQ